MTSFLDWVGATPLSQAMQNEAWMIPTIQAVHIGALAAVFTSALVLDLRLLGVSNRSQPLLGVTRRFAPWIGWGVLALAATGLLLMIAEPTRALLNAYFQVKMAALALVGAMTWSLVVAIERKPEAWLTPETDLGAKLIAVLSIALWSLILVAGRWIAYGP